MSLAYSSQCDHSPVVVLINRPPLPVQLKRRGRDGASSLMCQVSLDSFTGVVSGGLGSTFRHSRPCSCVVSSQPLEVSSRRCCFRVVGEDWGLVEELGLDSVVRLVRLRCRREAGPGRAAVSAQRSPSLQYWLGAWWGGNSSPEEEGTVGGNFLGTELAFLSAGFTEPLTVAFCATLLELRPKSC